MRILALRLATRLWALSLVLISGAAMADELNNKAPKRDDGNLVAQQYDVGELADEEGDCELICELVQACISPESWDVEGGPASIQTENNKLTVRQTREKHQQIGSLLGGLRTFPKIAAQARAAEAPIMLPRPVAKLKGADGKELQVTIYPVRDLADADLDPLEELLTSSIEPQSWDAAGGQGAIQPVNNRRLLVIVNSPDVHKRIMLLLTGLRKFPRADRKGAGVARAMPAARIDEWKTAGGGLMQLVAYPVASLIVEDDIEPLKEQILSTASPDSWDESGGEGTICYEPNRKLLVVSNTAAVQAQVAKVLAKVRGK